MKLFIHRPLLYCCCVVAVLLLAYWWYLGSGSSQEKRSPLTMNTVEPNQMRESMIQEVDDTEHLYLEQ